jgi:hypothetical protein
VDAPRDRGELRARRDRSHREANTAIGLPRKGAVDDDDVEVDVQVQASTEALHEGDGAASCVAHALALRDRAVAREDRADERAA